MQEAPTRAAHVAEREANQAFEQTFRKTHDMSFACDVFFRTWKKTYHNTVREIHHKPALKGQSVTDILNITPTPDVT